MSLPQDQYADSPWETAFLSLWGQSITPVVAEYLSWDLDVVTHAQLLMSAIRLSSVTFAKQMQFVKFYKFKVDLDCFRFTHKSTSLLCVSISLQHMA